MSNETLEKRVETLESKLEELQEQLLLQVQHNFTKKRGWRWFVGINADDPDFEEVVRIGQEWRNADRPKDEETE